LYYVDIKPIQTVTVHNTVETYYVNIAANITVLYRTGKNN